MTRFKCFSAFLIVFAVLLTGRHASATLSAKDVANARVSQDCSNSVNAAATAANPSCDDLIVPANFFGMHIGFPHQEKWPGVQFGTLRLWDSNVTWMNLEPQKGTWDFSTLDAIVASTRGHNVEIDLPLGMSPQWASSRPDEDCVYGGGGCKAPPTNMEDWITYVDAVVTRYKGNIHIYEIWNEVNATGFWSGTPEQLLALQKAAYIEIKRIDPTAKVISPSLVCDDGSYLNHMLDIGMAQYADVIGYHFYVSPLTPENIVIILNMIHSALQRTGTHLPVWNTETNWLPPVPMADDLGAAYVVRSMVVARSFGVRRYLWYQWDNHCCITIQMTQADNVTLTPASLAYQNLQSWLTGQKLSPCTADTTGTYSCRVDFTNGHRGLLVWHPGSSVQMPAVIGWKPTVVVDMYGHRSVYTGASLAVGDAPLLVRN